VNFSCDRCAKRYTLADAKVPPRGFRCTCTDCGHRFVVRPAAPALPPPPPPAPSRPSPAPVPSPASRVPQAAPAVPGAPRARAVTVAPAASPALRGASATAAARTSVRTSAPVASEPHDHFFDSAPGSHRAALTGSLTLALALGGRRGASHQAWIAAAAIAVVGMSAGGLWWSRQGGDAAAPGNAPAVQAGGFDRGARRPSPSAVEAPQGGAAAEPAPAQRGAAASPGKAPQAATQDALHRAGAPIDRSDKRLLDLLQRKADAPGVSASAAGEPGTGRAALDTGRATLGEAAIRNTLAANSGAFSACIARAGKADQGLRQDKRPPVLELVVRPTGHVASAALSDPAWARSALGQCLAAAARRMIFPSFEGQELRVQAPLKLSAVQ
jgi:predicted Zn finger-like uncharacterized protein